MTLDAVRPVPVDPEQNGAGRVDNQRRVGPTASLAKLLGVAAIFLALLPFVGGLDYSDFMLPAFWVDLDYNAMAPEWQYLAGNALFNLLGHAATVVKGAELTKPELGYFGIALVAACYTTVFASSIIRFGVERAAIFLGCLTLTMLDSTLLHWIGKADPMFVMAYLVVFFGRTNPWISGVGIALVVGVHREQGSVLAAVHLLILILERKVSVKVLAGLAVGYVVGFIGVEIYNQALHLGEARGRLDYALREGGSVISYSLKFVVRFISLSVPSILLGGWWLAINAMKDKRSTVLLLGAIALSAGVAATTHDFTRNCTLLGMPVIFYLAEYYARRWQAGTGLALKWVMVASFVALMGYEVQDNKIRIFTRPFIGESQ